MHHIDELRGPHYAKYGQNIVDPPGLQWYVAEDIATGQILAAAALGPSLEGPYGRSLIDVFGDDLKATNHLFMGLCAVADKQDLGLTIWMPLDHPSRIRYAMDRGFAPTAMLLHRARASAKEQAG